MHGCLLALLIPLLSVLVAGYFKNLKKGFGKIYQREHLQSVFVNVSART